MLQIVYKINIWSRVYNFVYNFVQIKFYYIFFIKLFNIYVVKYVVMSVKSQSVWCSLDGRLLYGSCTVEKLLILARFALMAVKRFGRFWSLPIVYGRLWPFLAFDGHLMYVSCTFGKLLKLASIFLLISGTDNLLKNMFFIYLLKIKT